jgi:hypothetical protein
MFCTFAKLFAALAFSAAFFYFYTLGFAACLRLNNRRYLRLSELSEAELAALLTYLNR